MRLSTKNIKESSVVSSTCGVQPFLLLSVESFKESEDVKQGLPVEIGNPFSILCIQAACQWQVVTVIVFLKPKTPNHEYS